MTKNKNICKGNHLEFPLVFQVYWKVFVVFIQHFTIEIKQKPGKTRTKKAMVNRPGL